MNDLNDSQINHLKHIYENLGWDSKHALQDFQSWNNPNDLDIIHELIVLTHWTKQNMWRRYTQLDYRMRFQSWLNRTVREKPKAKMVKVEPHRMQVPDHELYQQLPDMNQDWEAFEQEVIKRFKSGDLDLSTLPSNDPYIRGIIMLIDMGHLK